MIRNRRDAVEVSGVTYRFPVSAKGAIEVDGRLLLLRNERNEWELPGGKLEIGEDLRSCLSFRATLRISSSGKA